MSLVFAFKIAVVPLLIGAVTLAGRRWGPAVAGWLSGFPIVTGPILVFIAMEQGNDFGSGAALATLAGLPAILAFNLGYAWSSIRFGWPASLLCAALSYALAVNGLVALELPAMFMAPLVLLVLLVAPRLFPPIPDEPLKDAHALGRADVLYRMIAAALLVGTVTHFAASMGPRWSGVMAMFPVISIVMAPFSHHTCGRAFAIRLLKGVILGWYALLTFCLLAALLLPNMGLWTACLLATAGAVAVQAGARVLMLRAARCQPAH